MNSLGNTKAMVAPFVYPPPSDGKPFKLNMGLRSLEAENWLEDGADLLDQIPERLQLAINQREIVYQELPGYRDAINELVSLVAGNLTQYHSANYQLEQRQLTHLTTSTTINLDSESILLDLASIIGEDLVVLAREDDQWKIVAGAVIFPSRWRLSEKIGKGMDAVHQPVPGYQGALAPYMTATFDKITVDRPVWRKNWSLHSTSDLHQPISIHEAAEPENYWWRTERQTLTRSAIGDFLYFTIRNRAEILSQIKEDGDASVAFAQTLESFTPETIEYKGLQRDHQAIIDFLRS